MPNWCITKISINHDDEKKLLRLEQLINKWTSENYMDNGFGLNWLGNIVGNSGIGTVDTNKETDLRCRGSLIYMENFGTQLVIDTETAWSPMMKMWTKLLDKYLPDAELIYSAEEGNMGFYGTNDPCLAGKYVIDSWENEVEPDFEASEETAREVLQKLLKTDETDIEVLLKMFEENEDIENISISQWKNYDVEEFD